MSELKGSGALDLHALLALLATRRPLFHSEADFQFALAWEMQQVHPHLAVRLEWPVRGGKRRAYVDIVVAESDGPRTAIELKYWTKRFTGLVNREQFKLPNQAAQDVNRYDFWKDVARLETLVREGVVQQGFAVALTNDPGYWRPGRADTIDLAFRLHDGREVAGTLAWGPAAGPGTTKNREAAITLEQRYLLSWRDFSTPEGGAADQLRYLVLCVPQPSTLP